jgi:ABC-type antimicrobial peptide transport system permease subunit
VDIDNAMAIWVSYFQQNTPTARPTIVVRSRVGPSALFPALRRAIWSVDPKQTIDSIDRLDSRLLKWTAQQRFAALVALLFATSALALVSSGIYAITLYGVIRRTRELGVRAALGAGPASLVIAAMWESVRAVLAGAGAGAIAAIPAALAMQRALTNGVTIADAPRIGLVLATLVTTACVAAFLPARHALAIPPALAMRE